ncbi:hypothetical protein [Desulfonatronovibrio hydrogenovorans]|uniref:hypothetical protein n=1 Tax=Desulfonatronovibrio hydrogenovorans TaxID=53245 RepID=UPI001237354A|nr:hypothetical protein [Desulfonatronovibrio hydrogenovorans]
MALTRIPVIQYQLSLEKDEGEVLAKLLKLGEDSAATKVLVPATDEEVLFLDRHRSRLEREYVLCLPRSDVLKVVVDKFQLQDELHSHGLSYPQSVLVSRPPGPDSNLADFCHPCLLKPVFSNEWKTGQAEGLVGANKVVLINNKDDLVREYTRISPISRQVILQKIIQQKDLENYSFCSYSDRNGKILHGFVTQKLIQYPDRFGTAVLCRTVENKRIFEYGSRVINALKYDGIAETEIIVEAGTDDLFVIEINPRHWMQHRLSTRLGMNYTLLDIYYRLGMQDKVDEMLSRHSKNSPAIWIDDVGYMIFALKNMLHPGKYFFKEVISSQREYSLFSVDDWRPFWHTLKSKFKRI